MRQHGQPDAWWRRLEGLRKRRDRADGPAADRGFTLVEVVLTISLIGIIIVPILDATFTSIRASTTSRESAEVETVLQNAADRVNRAPTLCGYQIYVEAAALAKGWQAGPEGHTAVTDFQVIERRGQLTWGQARPRTGRTHQIRLHATRSGVPVLGDRLYGAPAFDAPWPRLFLHAARMDLTHPAPG
ncbi:MAG: pseudouridine synthase, partial [Actinomycetota bacterium]